MGTVNGPPSRRIVHKDAGAKGIIAIGKSSRNGAVVAAKRVSDTDELVLISSNGYVTRMAVSDIRRIGRNTQGVRIMALQSDEKLVDAAKIELSSSLVEEGQDV